MKDDDATSIGEWLHKAQKTNKKKTNEDLLEDGILNPLCGYSQLTSHS